MDSEWEKIREKYNEANDPLKALGGYVTPEKTLDNARNLAESISETDRAWERFNRANNNVNAFGFGLLALICASILIVPGIIIVLCLFGSIFTGDLPVLLGSLAAAIIFALIIIC